MLVPFGVNLGQWWSLGVPKGPTAPQSQIFVTFGPPFGSFLGCFSLFFDIAVRTSRWRPKTLFEPKNGLGEVIELGLFYYWRASAKRYFPLFFLVVVACFSLRRCGREDSKNSIIHWRVVEIRMCGLFARQEKRRRCAQEMAPNRTHHAVKKSLPKLLHEVQKKVTKSEAKERAQFGRPEMEF